MFLYSKTLWKELKISSIAPQNNEPFDSNCWKISQQLFSFLWQNNLCTDPEQNNENLFFYFGVIDEMIWYFDYNNRVHFSIRKTTLRYVSPFQDPQTLLWLQKTCSKFGFYNELGLSKIFRRIVRKVRMVQKTWWTSMAVQVVYL